MTPEAAAILDQLDRQAPLPESYDDVQRIVHAPRADYDEVFAQIAMAWADERWRRPGAPMTFRPIQATAMLAAHLTHGALLPIGTGHGKSLLFLLIADALGAKRPLGLIPPSMRVPFERGRKEYALSFKVPPNLRIMAYSQLSVANSTDVLERLAPDVIVADEAHNLRNLDSARTKRLVRYMKAHPETLFVPMSGTLTSKSIADYCLAPGTRVLTEDLRWVPAETLSTGDRLVGFDEGLGRCKMQPSRVEGVKVIQQPRLRITTTRGTVVCSDLHGWVRSARQKAPIVSADPLTGKKATRVTRHWAQAKDLRVGDEVAFYVTPWEHDLTHAGGYVAGLLDGEGWVSRFGGVVGFAQKPGRVLDAFCKAVSDAGFKFTVQKHKSGVCRVMVNGEAPHMRLLGTYRPQRLMEKSNLTWEGKAPWGKNTEQAVVTNIEHIGFGDVVAVQTETRTLIAEGFLTHNSHLSEWALKRGSPVPHTKFFPVLQSFCAVLDAKNQKVSGDRYNVPAQAADFARMSPLFPDWQDYDADPVEDEYGRPGPSERVVRAREVFRQHLTTTAGVVATDTASIGASLLFIKREVQAPPVVLEAIDKLEASWCRPDGEELTDAPAIWRCARQLTQGFYYRWVWPEGKVDKDWMFARAAWHREIREVLKENRPHLDSPLLISRSARAALDERESLLADRDTLLNALKEWLPHSAKRWGGQRTPPTEPVWLSEYLLDDAAEWRKENPKGILWYGEGAVATKLAERGERVYGAGTDPEAVRGAHGMACSIAAHKDGKNLQYGHSTNLILTFDPSGTVMEQLISRTHRSGQEEDEVSLAYYAHTASAESAVTSALNNARYIEQTQGVPQRLCYGTWL